MKSFILAKYSLWVIVSVCPCEIDIDGMIDIDAYMINFCSASQRNEQKCLLIELWHKASLLFALAS